VAEPPPDDNIEKLSRMKRLEEGKLFEKCREWHDHHLEVYFGRRNLEQSLATYEDHAIGIGTGRSEYGDAPALLRDVVVRDLESFPDPVEYEVNNRVFFQITDEVVVCQACLTLCLDVDAHRMTLRDLRHTVTIRKSSDGQWRICHIHVSFPTDMHGDEESYPLKEIEEISALVDEMIASRTSDLTTAYRKLEHMAIHDRLTGLFNRIRIDEKLKAELLRSDRYGGTFSVILIDIDGFKPINDRFGHLAGDHVLRELAGLIDRDVRETDLAGRWGGDEFIIVLPETGMESAYALAERIRRDFSERRFDATDGAEFPVTISCGIAEHRPGDTVVSLFERADQALYEAKKQGRNRSARAA
jgi:diguanylate cyclase (GGDEF)-like protein